METGVDVQIAQRESVQCGDVWRSIHERVVRFAARRAVLEWEEGRLLREALAAGVHRRLGYAAFPEYVERLFGYGRRLIWEKLRVAEALEELPELSEALRRGTLTWCAVRELTRVAIPSTERVWLRSAAPLTAREVEQLVAGHRPGDVPDDPPDPRLRRYVLRLEVTGETRALFRDALGKLRRDTGEPIDEETALMLMARHVLDGNRDSGRSSYQIALNVCERCGQGDQQGNGERCAVGPAVIEMCECDAQVLNREGRPAAQRVPPARRRAVLRRDGGCCVVPGCRHALFIDVHHLVPRERGGDHDMENLVCLCGAHHRAVHDGRLLITGTPSAGLEFRHGDGVVYGGVSSDELT